MLRSVRDCAQSSMSIKKGNQLPFYRRPPPKKETRETLRDIENPGENLYSESP